MAEPQGQAAEQAAQQIAQAVAEAVRQAAAESTRQVIDASRTAASQEVGAEREFEIGKDEAWAVNMKSVSDAWIANMKRTYDEYQQESLESIKRNRSYVDKVLSDAQQHDNVRQTIANQALQNAVETANMVGKNACVNIDSIQKQHTAHRDIATDNLWNPIQQGAGDAVTMRSITLDDASLKGIGAAVAAAVASALTGGAGGKE